MSKRVSRVCKWCGHKVTFDVEKHDKHIYNNAIDDFKKMLTIEKIKEYAESDGFINLNNCSLMIYDIEEQLKAGVNK